MYITLVSSANLSMSPSKSSDGNERLLHDHAEKQHGPSLIPWGTPAYTGFQLSGRTIEPIN